MPYRRHLQDGSGAVEAAPPPPLSRLPHHHTRALPRRNHLLIPVVAAASALAVLAFIAAVLLCRWRRRRKRGSKTAPSSPHSSSRSPSASDLKKAHQIQQGKGGLSVPLQQQPSSDPRRFTYDQLRRATDGFSPANKLGQGGFGPVFRGVLPLPVAPGGVWREEVAVKQMDSGSLQGEIEFQNELSLAASMTRTAEGKVDDEELMRLQRKHVVLPLGFCSEDEPEDEWEARRRQQRKKKKKKRRKKKKRPGWFDAVDDDEDSDSDSDRVASGIDTEEVGEGVRKRVLLLVYELMHNGSLQDALLVRKCPELMSWPRRFAVAMDVARALKFLHTACDPPVVHGDIKPSNVLLDSQFNAKIADFGLARPLPASAPSPEAASPPVGAGGGIADVFKRKGDAVDLIGKDAGAVVIAIGGGDDNESTCTAAETESTFTACGAGAVAIDLGVRGSPEDDGCLSLPPPEGEEEPGSPDISPMRLEVASACEVGGFDRLSVDSGTMDGGGSRNGSGYPKKNASYGKDWWWWQQDPGVAATAKMTTSHVNEYVMKWIGTEVRKVPPNGNTNWGAVGGASNSSGTAGAESSGTATALEVGKKKHPRAAREWWASLDEERQKKGSGWKRGGSGSHHHLNQRRPPREWWREEFCEELARKSKRKQQQVQANSPTIRSVLEEGHATPLHSRKQHRRRRSWSRGSRASSDWRGPDTPSNPLGRRPSHDWAATASGDIPRSCAVSSTPSMRGTVCYAAPECGLSGEPPSEKCDIYSFGVLVLVIVSGRRPLQVTASPMSEFERANLVSWARGLACKGKNLLDLLDPGLQGAVERDQALLCVTVALLCLQRSPSRRPSIGDVVAMLSGETEPPHLPVEYSPSPQSSNYALRPSRRKTAR